MNIAKSLEKPTVRTNFCDEREQKQTCSIMPNGAKISKAKLAKEYACPNTSVENYEANWGVMIENINGQVVTKSCFPPI